MLGEPIMWSRAARIAEQQRARELQDGSRESRADDERSHASQSNMSVPSNTLLILCVF